MPPGRSSTYLPATRFLHADYYPPNSSSEAPALAQGAKSSNRGRSASPFVDGRNENVPILPKERDPRLITIRRGGTLTDLPAAIRELVFDDQQRRSAICWHVFDD